jgi:hypothetical protein
MSEATEHWLFALFPGALAIGIVIWLAATWLVYTVGKAAMEENRGPITGDDE